MTGRLSASLLGGLLEVNCPACDFGFEVQLVDAVCQVWRWCRCCRSHIRLVEPGGEVHGTMEEVDSAIRSLEKSLKGMFG